MTVKPGHRAAGISVDGDVIHICVRELALEGRANIAACRALARALDVPPSAVVLKSGEHSRHKRVIVAGLSRDEALERLRRTSGHG